MEAEKQDSSSSKKQVKHKHDEVAFLASRSAIKHVLFALGVDPTTRDAGEGGGSTSYALRSVVRD